ncbi:PIF1, partial [Symbiodinium pilosum]
MRSDCFFLYNNVEAAPHTWSFYDAGSLHQQTGTFASRRRALYNRIDGFLFNDLGVDTNNDQSGRSMGRRRPGIPAPPRGLSGSTGAAVHLAHAQMQKLHRTAQGKRALTLRLKQLLAIRSSCARELWARVEEHLGAEAVKEYQRRARTPGCALFLAPHPERRRGQSESSSRCVALPRLLCSADASVASNSTRGKQALKQLLALRSTDVLRLCGLFEEHLGSAALTYYKGRAGAEPRKTVQQQWKEELKLRHSVHPLPDQEGQRVWRERAREDGRMRDKKFGLAFSEQHSGRAWMSARGAALRVLGPRSLLVHVHRVPSAGASAVPPVQPRQEHPAPSSPEKMQTLRPGHRLQGARIPGPLRDLTATALWALCSCGEYGYRIHTDMTRLRWRPQSVQDQVACEARTWKERTQFFRLRPSYSASLSFVAQHDLFLAQTGCGPDKSARRLPVRFLETLQLETALWPHLYPAVALCETFVRLEDGRRV